MKLFTKGMSLVSVAVATVVLGATAAHAAPTVNGSGATFPAPVYTKWASDYRGLTGVAINYQGTGSSAGIDAMKKGVVDFGATDAPLTAGELAAANLVQFPTVIGGIVPVVNLQGLNKTLALSGKVMGDIYLGKITKWNDAAIAAINPGVNLPNVDIRVVRRSDGSGTTYAFTEYLQKSHGGWSASKAPNWIATTVGGKGNDGVAAQVKQLPGAIGYVEYAFAKKNGLPVANMINKAGKVVVANASSFGQAASSANWREDASMGTSLNNQAGAGAWPITSATYILVPKVTQSKAQTVEVLRFFEWAMTKGQRQASNLDYVPLPQKVYQTVKERAWKSMKDTSGQSVI